MWYRDAKCGNDPDILLLLRRRDEAQDPFFPHVKNGANLATARKIRAYCSDCPVIQQCKLAGMEFPSINFGFWGGESPTDRQRQKQRWAGRKRIPAELPLNSDEALVVFAERMKAQLQGTSSPSVA